MGDDICKIINGSNLRKSLAEWAVEDNIPGTSLRKLLLILRKHQCFVDLPKDHRSLLKTPRKVYTKIVEPGRYCHFDLSTWLAKIAGTAIRDLREINIQLNIDGLPISKSSNQQFWLVLCWLTDIPLSGPFVLGLYYGEDKPKSSNDFLHDTVQNILNCKSVIVDGIRQIVKVNVHSVVCDAPARAFILNVKRHTGYFGCQKCTVEGEYDNHRVTFPSSPGTLRTNSAFRNKENAEYHIGPDSELLKLPLDIVNQLPLDYQHLVCLGVVRKLINLWVWGNVSTYKLSAHQIQNLSKSLIKLKPFFAKEFSRRPRTIAQLRNWKATEFRTFLLYTGPYVLNAVLPPNHYLHFLCLHVSISILCSKEFNKKFLDYAEQLLVCFVKNFPILYGNEHLSYNVHNLLHLARDSRKFGVLDNFATFRFENHLRKIKKLVRSGNRPLEQVHNRIHEMQTIENKIGTTNCHSHWKPFDLTNTLGNNACLLKCGSVFIVNEIYRLGDSYKLLGRRLLQPKDLYSSPCSSQLIGISQFNHISCDQIVDFSEVAGKVHLYHSMDLFVAFPILHSRN